MRARARARVCVCLILCVNTGVCVRMAAGRTTGKCILRPRLLNYSTVHARTCALVWVMFVRVQIACF